MITENWNVTITINDYKEYFNQKNKNKPNKVKKLK